MKQKKETKRIVFRRWTRKSYAVFSSLHKVVHIGVLSIAALLNTQQLCAQSLQKDSATFSTTQLKDILIEAEADVPFQQMVTVVAVINKQDIEQAAVKNLQDLLRYVQGVDIRSRGSEGVQADISLRGGTFDQFLILLNGVNYTDPQTGHHSLNLPFTSNSIEYIEILQGPFVWNAGTTAFCGAINIVTKKTSETGGQIDISYGEYGTLQLEGIANIHLKKGFILLSAGHAESKGFTSNTDYDLNNIYLTGGVYDKTLGGLDFQVGYQQKEFGANNFYSAKYKEQYEETKSFISSVKYNKQLGNWHLLFNAYQRRHYDMFMLFRNTAPNWYLSHNYHLTDIWGGNFKTAYTSKIGITTLGVDYRNEHILSSGIGNLLEKPEENPFNSEGIFKYGTTREYISSFLQHQITIKKWKASLGVMSAGNSKFGVKWYAAGSISYSALKNLDISWWLQNTYRLPTFTDLFYKSPTQKGNPNLHPEEAISTELSANWKPNNWILNISGFHRYGFENIDWVKYNMQDEVWHSKNIANIAATGINTFAEYKLNKYTINRLRFSYDFLHVTNNTKGYFSLYTNNYLQNQCKLLIDNNIGKHFSAHWIFSLQDRIGNYFDYETQSKKPYTPYVLCNLKILWTKNCYTLYAEVINLFNTSYLDIENLPQPRRWCKIGISIK